MSDPELVPVGRVGRPHGVDGSFFVEDPSEVEGRFARGARLWVDGFEAEIVVSKRGSGGRPVLKLDRAVDRGVTLSVPREDLPEPAEDTYYVFQLVGLDVEEEGGRVLGSVIEVHNGPANDSLELESGLLLPLVAACVLGVDLDAGRVHVARGFADDE
ncbi:MAG: 16S rRNA processing protein RimM [Actinobacteria bacterium]|nr:16S rRNA processing protein RimM [Actinomycetota bacterium]